MKVNKLSNNLITSSASLMIIRLARICYSAVSKSQSQSAIQTGNIFNEITVTQKLAEAEKTTNICYIHYGVTFPMLEKSQVKKAAANGFFQKLIKSTGEVPAWNFHKYLIDRSGTSLKAFPSNVTPEQLDSKISAFLLANYHSAGNEFTQFLQALKLCMRSTSNRWQHVGCTPKQITSVQSWSL